MKVPYNFVVSSSRDSCATNNAGLRVIQPLYPAMVNIMCYSHMLQGTGSRFGFTALDEFVTPFVTLQSMAIVRTMWKSIVGTSMKSFSKIRWWSRWDCMMDLGKAFGPSLDEFIQALIDADVGNETTKKMDAVLKDPMKRTQLELELAIIMDMKLFKTTTYTLEGDGLCILVAHRLVEALRAQRSTLNQQSSMPNTAAVLRKQAKLEAGVRVKQYWSEQDAPGQSGWYHGEILNKKPGHGQLCAIRFTNGEEMWVKKDEESTFRSTIEAHELPVWKEVVAKIMPAFEYVDNRLTDNCDTPYHMRNQHECMFLFQVTYYKSSVHPTVRS